MHAFIGTIVVSGHACVCISGDCIISVCFMLNLRSVIKKKKNEVEVALLTIRYMCSSIVAAHRCRFLAKTLMHTIAIDIILYMCLNGFYYSIRWSVIFPLCNKCQNLLTQHWKKELKKKVYTNV